MRIACLLLTALLTGCASTQWSKQPMMASDPGHYIRAHRAEMHRYVKALAPGEYFHYPLQ